MEKPFLKDVSSLSGDARSVLPAAYMLDGYLTQLYTSALEANRQLNPFSPVLEHYQVIFQKDRNLYCFNIAFLGGYLLEIYRNSCVVRIMYWIRIVPMCRLIVTLVLTYFCY